MLRGDTEIGSIVRELARRGMLRLRTRASHTAGWITGADTPVRRVRNLLRRLDGRGVPVWLVYGGYDPGLGELATYFGSGGRVMRRYRNVRLCISDRIDHALRAYTARDAVLALLDSYLRTHFCVTRDAEAAREKAVPAAGMETSKP